MPRLLVVAGKGSKELSMLSSLGSQVEIQAVGQTVEELNVSDDELAKTNVVLNCGVGENAGKREVLMTLWPKLTSLQWLHSSSAGLEKLLFPELTQSTVPVTNAKGVYSHSLAEFALTCCNWFAKDLPRMRAAQKRAAWEPFDVEELRGKVMGIIGFGDIGQACGRLALAFGMTVYGLRRNSSSPAPEGERLFPDKAFTPDQLLELVAASDYIVMATPFTPNTHKLFSAEAIAAMKPSAVFINVGRGKCVDEPALIDALQQGAIRGAGLDVVYEEPLPASSPLYALDNVLLSPHCADRTKEFQLESMEFFITNMKRFCAGEPLLNIVDKQSGY